jgi:hypothetical protein
MKTLIQLGGLAVMVATLATGCSNSPRLLPATTTTYRPGYVTSSLPAGYRSEIIGRNTYYVYGDAYYRATSGGYIVVEQPF